MEEKILLIPHKIYMATVITSLNKQIEQRRLQTNL